MTIDLDASVSDAAKRRSKQMLIRSGIVFDDRSIWLPISKPAGGHCLRNLFCRKAFQKPAFGAKEA